jgi:arylsulfatase A-like enzyme
MNIKPRIPPCLPALVLAACAITSGAWTPLRAAVPGPTRQQPNIVFILADDIGYGDFGCYGATKIKTPNVDQLARQGLRFTDAHSAAAVCTPTRYALLTGQYAFRNPLGSHILPGDAPLSIKPGTLTVPAVLKQAGYATAVLGKWHLGLGDRPAAQDWNGDIKPGPLEVGFDQCFIIPATGDRTPCLFVENHRVFNLDPNDPITVDYKNCRPGHSNPVGGIGRIGDMRGGKAAVWKDEAIAATLTARALKFLEQSKDHPFFLYLATHDIHVPRVPAPQFRGASKAGVRGDAVQEFDWTVGQVMASLDRLRLTDNTLVIVTSDNGGVLDHGDSVERDGGVESNNGHAFNGPLRGQKGTPYEGGTRVPFIARWPGKIRPGTSDELVCLVDILATCGALVGRELPGDAGPDSFNFLPVLKGEKLPKPVRSHLVEQAARMALRQGPWKFISAGNRAAKRAANTGSAELYNLADDLGEATNLASRNPEKVKELSALLEQICNQPRSRPE